MVIVVVHIHSFLIMVYFEYQNKMFVDMDSVKILKRRMEKFVFMFWVCLDFLEFFLNEPQLFRVLFCKFGEYLICFLFDVKCVHCLLTHILLQNHQRGCFSVVQSPLF